MAKKNNQRNAPTKRPTQTNAGPNPMGRPAQSKPPTVNRSLKIAGTGGITKQELQKISKTTGRSGAQVIQRLDALNQKIKGRDQVGISLNSGAANMLIREAQKEPVTMKSLYGGNERFGTGRIGQQLQGMLGTRDRFGVEGTPGTGRMMGGTAIRPGGRTTVRGFGKQFAGMPTAGEGTMMPTTETATGATEEAPIESYGELPFEELPPEEEKVDQMMPGSSADLANWATGFKTARSSRKRSGPRAQGLASQRVNPTGAFRGGM
jgi:hypothetical protein